MEQAKSEVAVALEAYESSRQKETAIINELTSLQELWEQAKNSWNKTKHAWDADDIAANNLISERKLLAFGTNFDLL